MCVFSPPCNTQHHPSSSLFPYTTLFRSGVSGGAFRGVLFNSRFSRHPHVLIKQGDIVWRTKLCDDYREADRKSTRLNSSHRCISYAVFCLKKKKYISMIESKYSNLRLCI